MMERPQQPAAHQPRNCCYKDRDFQCGCQGFLLRRKPKRKASAKGKKKAKATTKAQSTRASQRPTTHTRSRARTASAAESDDDDDDDDESDEEEDYDEQICTCTHYLNFHAGWLPDPPRSQEPRLPGLSASQQEMPPLQYNNTTVSAISTGSGTTTVEEVSSSASAASSVIKPHILTHVGQTMNQVDRSSTSTSLAPSSSVSVSEAKLYHIVQKVLNENLASVRTEVASVKKRVGDVEEDIAGKIYDRLDHIEADGEIGREDQTKTLEEIFEDKFGSRLTQMEEILRQQQQKEMLAQQQQQHRRERKRAQRENDESVSSSQKRQRHENIDNNAAVRHTESPLPLVSGQVVTHTTSFTNTISTSTTSQASFTSPGSANRGDEQTTEKLTSLVQQIADEFASFKAEQRLRDQQRQLVGPMPSELWSVTVILLPPPTLTGVWYTADDPPPNTQYSDSSGPEDALYRTTRPLLPQQQIGDLRARSFTRNHALYQRLLSRRFVSNVKTDGRSTQHVDASIEEAFGELFDWIDSLPAASATQRSGSVTPRPGSITPRQSRTNSQAQEALPLLTRPTLRRWQPLRKIFQQKFLEHITTTELNSPGSWNVQWLEEYCVQRGKIRKLYIAPFDLTPRSYTWDDIYDLKRASAEELEKMEVPDERTIWSGFRELDEQQGQVEIEEENISDSPDTIRPPSNPIDETNAEAAGSGTTMPPPATTAAGKNTRKAEADKPQDTSEPARVSEDADTVGARLSVDAPVSDISIPSSPTHQEDSDRENSALPSALQVSSAAAVNSSRSPPEPEPGRVEPEEKLEQEPEQELEPEPNRVEPEKPELEPEQETRILRRSRRLRSEPPSTSPPSQWSGSTLTTSARSQASRKRNGRGRAERSQTVEMQRGLKEVKEEDTEEEKDKEEEDGNDDGDDEKEERARERTGDDDEEEEREELQTSVEPMTGTATLVGTTSFASRSGQGEVDEEEAGYAKVSTQSQERWRQDMMLAEKQPDMDAEGDTEKEDEDGDGETEAVLPSTSSEGVKTRSGRTIGRSRSLRSRSLRSRSLRK